MPSQAAATLVLAVWMHKPVLDSRRLKARPVALEVIARLPLQHRPGQRVVVVAVRRDGLAEEDLAVAWDTAERDLQAAPQQRPGVAPPADNGDAGIAAALSLQ